MEIIAGLHAALVCAWLSAFRKCQEGTSLCSAFLQFLPHALDAHTSHYFLKWLSAGLLCSSPASPVRTLLSNLQVKCTHCFTSFHVFVTASLIHLLHHVQVKHDELLDPLPVLKALGELQQLPFDVFHQTPSSPSAESSYSSSFDAVLRSLLNATAGEESHDLHISCTCKDLVPYSLDDNRSGTTRSKRARDTPLHVHLCVQLGSLPPV